MGIRKLQQLQQTTLTGILVQNWRNTRSAVVPNSWRWVSFPNHSMLSVPQLFNDKQQMVPTRYEWSFKFLYCDALRIIHCFPHLNMEKPNEPRESFEPSSGNRQMSKSMRQSLRKKKTGTRSVIKFWFASTGNASFGLCQREKDEWKIIREGFRNFVC